MAGTVADVFGSLLQSLSSTIELDAPWSGLPALDGGPEGASPCFGGSDDSLESDLTGARRQRPRDEAALPAALACWDSCRRSDAVGIAAVEPLGSHQSQAPCCCARVEPPLTPPVQI